MKILLLASVAMAIPAAFDTCETVTIKGADGQPLRVNKADYDADQAEGGANKMTIHKNEQPQSDGSLPAPTSWPEGVAPTAAPSAPNFSPAPGGGAPVMDTAKNAAAPTAPSATSKLVSKEGTGAKAKYFVVDGTGAKIAGFDEKGYGSEAEAWKAIMDSANTPPIPPSQEAAPAA